MTEADVRGSEAHAGIDSPIGTEPVKKAAAAEHDVVSRLQRSGVQRDVCERIGRRNTPFCREQRRRNGRPLCGRATRRRGIRIAQDPLASANIDRRQNRRRIWRCRAPDIPRRSAGGRRDY